MSPRAAAVALIAIGLAGAAVAAPPGAKRHDLKPPPADVATSRIDPKLASAVADGARPESERKRDVFRHPAETLAFWGLKPGETVVDLQPGGGYWTQVIAPYAKATGGHYVAGGGLRGKDAFLAKFADPRFGQIAYAEFGPKSGPFVPPGSADLVISSREIHNWMRAGMLDKAMADAFAALKPGGVFGVEEHRADGTKVNADGSQGYVLTATVVDAAKKAGFKLAAASEINANPKDTKLHPFGVWTLPPTRQSSGAPDADAKGDPNFDHTTYDAIGESDRMTLRFEKPKA